MWLSLSYTVMMNDGSIVHGSVQFGFHIGVYPVAFGIDNSRAQHSTHLRIHTGESALLQLMSSVRECWHFSHRLTASAYCFSARHHV